MTGKNNDKSGVPTNFKYTNDLIKNPEKCRTHYVICFTGPSLANAIPEPKKQFTQYLQNCPTKNQRSYFMKPTYVNEIRQIILSLQHNYDNLSPYLLNQSVIKSALPIAILKNKYIKV